MSEFKVGDRVIAINDIAVFGVIGKTGVIKSFETSRGVNVLFDGKKQTLYMRYNELELAKPTPTTHPTVIIHTDGITTTALLKEGKKVVKRAHAVCSPSDTYNHEYGVTLALDRLFGHEVKAVPPSIEAEDKAICAQALRLAKKRNVGSLSITAFPQKGDKDTPTFCTVSEQAEFKVIRYETYHPEAAT